MSISCNVLCIVPCFNEEKRFPKYAASLRAQTIPVHILAVDDGSSDNTIKAIGNNADFFIRSSYNNYPRSFNDMLDYASPDIGKYKYIMWGAADEVHYPNSIEKRIKFCEENDLDGVVAGTDQVFKDGRVMNWPECLPQFSRLKDADLSLLYYELLCQNFLPWPIFMRLKNVDLNDIKMDENLYHLLDWDQNIRLAKKYKFGFLNEALQVEEWDDHNLSAPTYKNEEEKRDETQYIRFKQLLNMRNEDRRK